jgi:hypothetical protein
VANPELIDCDKLTTFCAREAEAQGHARGTAEFLHATKQIFDKHIADVQSPQTPTEPAMETPKFFAPPPQARPRPNGNGPVISAPPSREVPSGGPRAEYETNPRYVHLSVEEKEIARASGIDEITYAKNKLKLQGMKARGEVQ